MRHTLALLLLAMPILAEDSKEVAKLKQDLKLSELKSLVLQEQLTTKSLEQIRAEIETRRVEVCKDAHVDPAPTACQIDLNAKTVTAAKTESQTQAQTQAKKP